MVGLFVLCQCKSIVVFFSVLNDGRKRWFLFVSGLCLIRSHFIFSPMINELNVMQNEQQIKFTHQQNKKQHQSTNNNQMVQFLHISLSSWITIRS